MKIKRSTLIPVILLVYLAVMSTIGWKQYASGDMNATEYFGIIALTLAVIVALHFSLKRRERLRAERMADIERNQNNNNTI
ncbi:MAG: hypothetical protein K2M54_09785 [Muribaculaceae bacterium]|nr:hypothetical protein [Muribaculaceae bacterium]